MTDASQPADLERLITGLDPEFSSAARDGFMLDNWRAIRAALIEGRELRELAAELAEFALDAAGQGSGNTPLSSPTWHNFMSTWEWADSLFRRLDFQALLGDEVREALLAQPAAGEERERG